MSVSRDYRSRFDRHRVGDAAHLQDRVRSHDLIARHLDTGGLERLEAGDGDRNVALAGADELNVVVALAVRRGLVYVS